MYEYIRSTTVYILRSMREQWGKRMRCSNGSQLRLHTYSNSTISTLICLWDIYNNKMPIVVTNYYIVPGVVMEGESFEERMPRGGS